MLSRPQALAHVEEYTKSESLRKHMLSVEAAMRERIERLGEVGDIDVGRCDRQRAVHALTKFCTHLREHHQMIPRAQAIAKHTLSEP